MKRVNYNSIAILYFLIILLSSCSTVNIKNLNSPEWENKVVKKNKIDTTEKKSLEPVIIDSLGNGLYKGFSLKKINEGTTLYFVKHKEKVTKLRYCPITRVHNFRFAERKLKPYLAKEQLNEIIKILTVRVNF